LPKYLTLSKFRITNHKLPVENGRWKNIARENRICPLCNNGDIGDEFHYLFKCQYFGNHLKYLSSFRKPNYLYIFCNSMPSANRLLKKATFGDIDQ
jgi:hypothetical protein